MVITLLLSAVVSNAQIKNAKIATVKIYGNCGMCEATIEKAGNLKKVAKVDWDQDTKMAIVTYDAKKTTQDEILKRIALAGYDSDKFLAPDDVYNNLHGCCQYDRVAKVTVKGETKMKTTNENHSNHGNHSATPVTEVQNENQLKTVLDNYFIVKDALVKSDGNATAIASKELLTAVSAVKMDKLEMNVHMVWMKVLNQIKEDAEHISDTKDVKHQREHFMTLSKNIYTLIKVSKNETPVYYQFCPMANGGKGANWLSKENAVKNPYYGSMMLSCGKTVETIN
ncbi:mercury transporter [Flavobacterium cauense R2A-7]|nr:mercury transporter [Flavobacterium cauense R2A-7]